MYISNKWMLLGFFALFSLVITAQPVQEEKKKVIVEREVIVERRATVDTLSKEDAFEKQYQINILKSHINGVRIPKDLYASFDQLKLLMDRPTLLQFQMLPEERAARKVYLVMWIAQNWNFREGSKLSHLIRKMGITYPEHMAHFIVMTFHRHLNKKDLDIKERVTFYKQKEAEAFEKAKEKQKGEILFEEKRKRKK